VSKYRAYSVYKESGVESIGDIPEHWENMKLKFLGEALIGITYSPSEIVNESSGILVFRSSNVQNSKIDYDDCVYVGKEVQEKLITKIGDILICSRNGSINLVGKNALIDESSAGVTFGAFMTIFRSQNYSFLRYFFNSQNFKNQSGLFSTSTINQLTTGVLNNIVAPIPKSIIEQQQIAAFLDNKTAHLDTLIEKKQQMIGLLNEKRIALITQAVTKGLDLSVPMKDSGVEWLGNVPEHWVVNKINYVLNAIGDVDHYMPESVEKGIPYVMTGDLKEFVSSINFKDCKQVSHEDYMKLSKKIKSSKGDLIVARYATIGTASYVDIDADFLVSYSCVTIKPNLSKALGLYLFYYFKSNAFLQGIQNEINTNTQGNVGINDLKKVTIALPTLAEQSKIVDYFNQETTKLDRMINTVQSAIAKLQEYRTALITAAVTGKIDVRTQPNLSAIDTFRGKGKGGTTTRLLTDRYD
jgi:type I restriction enzyme S subunit